jgi:hypothetical protein
MRLFWIGAFAGSMLGVLTPTYAAGEYRMTGCSVHEASINVGFTTESKAIRWISIGPRGVTLGGDVKGATPLESVKQFRFTARGVLVYEPQNGPEIVFGPITSECRAKFERVVAPLANIKEGDG